MSEKTGHQKSGSNGKPKRNILVIYDSNDKSANELSPEDQLKKFGYIVTVAHYTDATRFILSKGHSTDYILADALLYRNAKETTMYASRGSLVNIAKQEGIMGVGILTDHTNICPVYKGMDNGVPVIVSREFWKFGQRNWEGLFENLRSFAAKKGIKPRPPEAEPSEPEEDWE